MKNYKHHQFNGIFWYPVGEYFEENLNVAKKITTKIKWVLKKYPPNSPVCLWGRGSSGAIIASIVASRIDNAKVIYVKKDNESSHHEIDDIYIASDSIHIIIDDFMESGETFNEIYFAMKEREIETVNILALSGTVEVGKLDFVPEHIISRKVV